MTNGIECAKRGRGGVALALHYAAALHSIPCVLQLFNDAMFLESTVDPALYESRGEEYL